MKIPLLLLLLVALPLSAWGDKGHRRSTSRPSVALDKACRPGPDACRVRGA